MVFHAQCVTYLPCSTDEHTLQVVEGALRQELAEQGATDVIVTRTREVWDFQDVYDVVWEITGTGVIR